MADSQDTGPLDWRIAITDKAGRPTPEFQRRWTIQRNNNALIGSITFGMGVPTGQPKDGAEYVDTTTTPYTLYIGRGNSWVQTGTAVFTDLKDVPHSYTSTSDKLVRVKSTADGLEFISLSSVLDGLSSTQGAVLYRDSSGWAALTPGTSGQVLTTGGTGANPAWMNGGSGSGDPYEATPTIPVTGQFTLINGGSSVLSSLSNGILLLDSSSPSNQTRFLQDNTGPPATPYTIIMRSTIPTLIGTTNNYSGLIVLQNNSSGIIAIIGKFQQSFVCQTGPGLTSGLTTNITGPTVLFGGTSVHWFAISNDGTNLGFWLSEDGIAWGQIGSGAISTLLGAGSLNIGLGLHLNGSIGGTAFQSYIVKSGTTP